MFLFAAAPRSEPLAPAPPALSTDEHILQLCGEVNDTLDGISETYSSDRLCAETLGMTCAVEPKLDELVKLAIEDNRNWKNSGGKRVLPGRGGDVPFLANSLVLCTLCNRSVQDNPRGSAPLLLAAVAAMINAVDSASRYERLHDNYFEEDAPAYASYLSQIDRSLAELLLVIWRKINAEAGLLASFVPSPSMGGGHIAVLEPLFALAEKPATSLQALQALLLACGSSDDRVLAHFSCQHDHVRHWITSLRDQFSCALEALRDVAGLLCQQPDHLEILLELSDPQYRSDRSSSSTRSSKAALLERVGSCRAALVLVAAIHASLLQRSDVLSSSGLPAVHKYRVSCARRALAHIAQGFADEFMAPAVELIMECSRDDELVAAYTLLSLLLNSVRSCTGTACVSAHVLLTDAVGENNAPCWGYAEQSLLALSLRALTQPLLLDLCWGRLGSTSKPVAISATRFLATIVRVGPPLAGLSLLLAVEPSPLWTAPTQYRDLDQQQSHNTVGENTPPASFVAQVEATLEAAIHSLRRHRLLDQSQRPISTALRKYADAISQDILAAILSAGDALVAHPEPLDCFEVAQYRVDDLGTDAQQREVGGDRSMLGRLLKRLAHFHNLHVNEQIALSELLQRALVLLAAPMVLGSEGTASAHLQIQQQLLLQLESLRSAMFRELGPHEEERNRRGAKAIHDFLLRGPTVFPLPPPPPPPNATSSFFGFFAKKGAEAPAAEKEAYPELRPFRECGASRHLVASLVIIEEMILESLSCLVSVQKLRVAFASPALGRDCAAALASMSEGSDAHFSDCDDSTSIQSWHGMLCEEFKSRELPLDWDTVECAFEQEFAQQWRRIHRLESTEEVGGSREEGSHRDAVLDCNVDSPFGRRIHRGLESVKEGGDVREESSIARHDWDAIECAFEQEFAQQWRRIHRLESTEEADGIR